MAKKRQRDYKAEYERRIALGAAKGKTRQQARGHIAKEHVERARRTQLKYGASPSTLTRWRKLAFERALEIHRKSAKHAIYEPTLKKGIRILHIDDLKALAEADPFDVISAVKIQQTELAGLEQYFPHSMDNIDAEQFNPLWYHR